MSEGRRPVDRVNDPGLPGEGCLDIVLAFSVDGLLANQVASRPGILERLGKERLDLDVGLRYQRVIALDLQR